MRAPPGHRVGEIGLARNKGKCESHSCSVYNQRMSRPPTCYQMSGRAGMGAPLYPFEGGRGRQLARGSLQIDKAGKVQVLVDVFRVLENGP
jgi:hypothetical protein